MKLVLPFALFGALACGDPPAQRHSVEPIRSFLIEQRCDRNMDSLQAVIFLSEGGCIGCSRSLSKLVEDRVHDRRVAVILEATGAVLDISPYIDPSTSVVRDMNGFIRNSGYLNGSGIILLGNGAIDTTISLNAKELGSQISYIAERLPAM